MASDCFKFFWAIFAFSLSDRDFSKILTNRSLRYAGEIPLQLAQTLLLVISPRNSLITSRRISMAPSCFPRLVSARLVLIPRRHFPTYLSLARVTLSIEELPPSSSASSSYSEKSPSSMASSFSPMTATVWACSMRPCCRSFSWQVYL